jgi:hypothetical protein
MRPLPTQANTDTHALSGIRTNDPSVSASENLSWLRPCGNCANIISKVRYSGHAGEMDLYVEFETLQGSE